MMVQAVVDWRWVIRAVALLAAAVPVILLGSCKTAEVQPTGACINPPPGSEFIGEMTQKECREICPACTWRG